MALPDTVDCCLADPLLLSHRPTAPMGSSLWADLQRSIDNFSTLVRGELRLRPRPEATSQRQSGPSLKMRFRHKATVLKLIFMLPRCPYPSDICRSQYYPAALGHLLWGTVGTYPALQFLTIRFTQGYQHSVRDMNIVYHKSIYKSSYL